MDTDILNIMGDIDSEPRRHGIIKPGEVVPQGDIYLHKLVSGRTDREGITEDRAELQARIQKSKFWRDFSFGPLGERTSQLQLVNGTSLGASHRIADKDRNNVEIYAPSAKASPLEGPVVVVKCDGVVLTHHEHADHELAEGVYAVTYQRDYAAESLARVMD